MNLENLKKLLAAGLSVDEAIALSSDNPAAAAPADKVAQVIDQMSKSLNQQPVLDRLAAVESMLEKCVTALTTIIPAGLDKQNERLDEMHKSLTPIQEQMSKALGTPRGVQSLEGGEHLPDAGAAPQVDEAAKKAAEFDEMQKSMPAAREKALKALQSAKASHTVVGPDVPLAITAINGALTPAELASVCKQFKLDV